MWRRYQSSGVPYPRVNGPSSRYERVIRLDGYHNDPRPFGRIAQLDALDGADSASVVAKVLGSHPTANASTSNG